MMWIEVTRAEDFKKFVNTLYMSLCELVLLAKVINIWQHADDAWNFFATARQNELFALKTVEERKYWSQVTQRYRRIATMFISMGMLTILIDFVTVIFRPDYVLPYPYATPFEWRNGRHYWYAYFHELLAMPLTCLSNLALDMIAYYMLLHISLCYKLIGMRLAKLGQNTSEHSFQLELIDAIKLHQCVKSLSKQCESVVSFQFIGQIICFSYVMCFSVFLLQQVHILEKPSQFLYLIFFVSLITLEVFLPYYFGNEIIINSSVLKNEIYKSTWPQQSTKMRTFIFIYMEFLKKPVTIRLENFFDIGMPLFKQILNNAYGLMAVLFNLNQ